VRSSDISNADSPYLARCLVAWPVSRIGSRLELPPDTEYGIDHGEDGAARQSVPLAAIHANAKAEMRAYNNQLGRLLKASRVQSDGSIDFGTLALSRAADNIRRDFANDAERHCRAGGRYFSVVASAAKIAEQAQRIAGCLALFANPDLFLKLPGAIVDSFMREVDADCMLNGVKLAAFYLDEASERAAIRRRPTCPASYWNGFRPGRKMPPAAGRSPCAISKQAGRLISGTGPLAVTGARRETRA
jgi:Protein of unknown function (DUF3987)